LSLKGYVRWATDAQNLHSRWGKLTGIIEDRDQFGILQNPINTYPTLNHDGVSLHLSGMIGRVNIDIPRLCNYGFDNQQHLLDWTEISMRVCGFASARNGRLLAAEQKRDHHILGCSISIIFTPRSKSIKVQPIER
jgi:hypothetical protein